MIPRDYYIELIEEIRNIEKISIDDFIKERLEPLMKQDNHFVETLYKDIHYLIHDIDKECENDLLIKDGNLVIENGGIKLTGYQSRLHSIAIWLHMQMVEKFTLQDDPLVFMKKMEDFEVYHLKKPNYTPEYKAKLDKIKESLIEERRQNLNKKKPLIKRITHWKKMKKITIFGGGGILAALLLVLNFSNELLDLWQRMCPNPTETTTQKPITSIKTEITQIGDKPTAPVFNAPVDSVHIGDINNNGYASQSPTTTKNKLESPKEILQIIPNSYFIESNEDEFSQTKSITNYISNKLQNVVDNKEQAENHVRLKMTVDTSEHDLGTKKTVVEATITIINKNRKKEAYPLTSSQDNYKYYNTQFRDACNDINRQIDSLFNERNKK